MEQSPDLLTVILKTTFKTILTIGSIGGFIGVMRVIFDAIKNMKTQIWMKKKFEISVELWNGQLRDAFTHQLGENLGNQVTCTATLDQKKAEVERFKINGIEDDGPRVDLKNTIYDRTIKEQARKLSADKITGSIETIEVWIKNIRSNDLFYCKVGKKQIERKPNVKEFLKNPTYSDGEKSVLVINAKEIKLITK